MEPSNIPWYLNWPFWTLAVAAITTILSQIPPIRVLVKKSKIELDLYSKIAITHKVGNPNLQLHLIISNTGGRKIKVKDMTVIIERNSKGLVKLPAQNYLQNQADQNAVLFTKFSLNPGEEWAHITNFLNFLEREQEGEYVKYEMELAKDYQGKREELGEDHNELIMLDPSVVKPFNDIFENCFIWKAGEYTMIVNVITDHASANVTKKYRFTIFESHEKQLKIITDYFKFGGGIWWNPPIQTNVILELKEI